MLPAEEQLVALLSTCLSFFALEFKVAVESLRAACEEYAVTAQQHLRDAALPTRAALHDNAASDPMHVSECMYYCESKLLLESANRRVSNVVFAAAAVNGESLGRVVLFLYGLCEVWRIIGKGDESFLNPNRLAAPASSSSASASTSSRAPAELANAENNDSDDDNGDDDTNIDVDAPNDAPTRERSDARIASARAASLNTMTRLFDSIIAASSMANNADDRRTTMHELLVLIFMQVLTTFVVCCVLQHVSSLLDIVVVTAAWERDDTRHELDQRRLVSQVHAGRRRQE